MNTHITRAAALAGVAAVLCGGAALGTAAAHADGGYVVYLSDTTVAQIVDAVPVCSEEDCSDQPGQVGMWLDQGTGNWYLELGASVTLLVVDDTAAAR